MFSEHEVAKISVMLNRVASATANAAKAFREMLPEVASSKEIIIYAGRQPIRATALWVYNITDTEALVEKLKGMGLTDSDFDIDPDCGKLYIKNYVTLDLAYLKSGDVVLLLKKERGNSEWPLWVPWHQSRNTVTTVWSTEELDGWGWKEVPSETLEENLGEARDG